MKEAKQKANWTEHLMKKALEGLTFEKLTFQEIRMRFPQLSMSTVQRRYWLIKYGVPIEIACMKVLKVADYAEFLSPGVTCMNDIEKIERKQMKLFGNDTESIKTESDNGYGDSNPETEGEPDRKFCSVPFCSSDSEKEPHLTFFSLPTTLNQVKLWAKRCKKPEWADPAKVHFAMKYTLVCAHHFTREMFVDEEKTELKATAVPSLEFQDPLKNSGRSVIMDLNGQVRGIIEPDPLEVDPLAIDSTSEVLEPNIEPENMDVIEKLETQETFQPVTHKTRSSRLKSLSDAELKQKNERINEIKDKIGKQLKEKEKPTSTILDKIRSANNIRSPKIPASSRYYRCIAPDCTKLAEGGYYTCKTCRDIGYVACAIRGCRRLFNSKKNKTSYVYFPVQEDLRIKWLRAIRKPSNWRSEEGIVCLRHFQKPNDFITDDHGSTLKLDAVPSLALGFPKSKTITLSKSKRTRGVPQIIVKKIVSRNVRNVAVKTEPSTSAERNVPAENEKPKSKMTFARRKMLLTLQRMRLVNENLKLKNEKLRLENSILEKQL